ncbi:MAG: hypothetical protein ACYTXY_17035 [Nostoc sp.]
MLGAGNYRDKYQPQHNHLWLAATEKHLPGCNAGKFFCLLREFFSRSKFQYSPEQILGRETAMEIKLTTSEIRAIGLLFDF